MSGFAVTQADLQALNLQLAMATAGQLRILLCKSRITRTNFSRNYKTPDVNQALSNAYLKRQGLHELCAEWLKLYYSR